MEVMLVAVLGALASHLGLGVAVSKVLVKIGSCTKCMTFWLCVVYALYRDYNLFESAALGIAASYLSIWCEIGFVRLNGIYNKLWERVARKK